MARSSQLAVVLLLLGIALPTLYATLKCKPHEKLYENRCIGVYRPGPRCPTDFNQTAAEDYCQALNGELVSIHSQAENDFIKNLIKSSQHAHAKKLAAKAKCGCHIQQQDYMYWIGLELNHAANGSVNGASWTDGSAVNYGNPTSASFRPPFVTGHPVGSVDDGSDPEEVCPLGNESKCVQIYGFGSTTLGKWTDKHCSNQHKQNVTCGCADEPQGNSTAIQKSSSSSSSSANDDDEIDECRDEAALNGLICKRCPEGWTPFQNHCYLALSGNKNPAQSHAACDNLGAKVTSIHSAAENHFVSDLAQAQTPGAANFIGLSLTHASNAQNAPVTAASWSDGTPVDYGNPMVAPWSARGVYPWGTGSVNPIYPPQPDNVPPPGNCVFMWQPGNTFQLPSEWEDVDCGQVVTGSTVCKI